MVKGEETTARAMARAEVAKIGMAEATMEAEAETVIVVTARERVEMTTVRRSARRGR